MKATRSDHKFTFVSSCSSLILAFLLFMAGCSSDSDTSTSPTNNNNTQNATFSVDGAVMLQTLDSTVQPSGSSQAAKSTDGRTLFQYEVIDQELAGKPTARMGSSSPLASSTALPSSSGSSNLLAIDANGNARLAINSNYPIKVMYTVTSPDGNYVYLVLDIDRSGNDIDYSRFIAQENCAFFKIKISDNSSSCVAEGLWVQEMDDGYYQSVSGNQKPIQFDDAGNLYFSASSFQRFCNEYTGCMLSPTSWKPTIYKVSASSGALSAITKDNQIATFFLVLPTGEIAYQTVNHSTRKAALYLLNNKGGVIHLTSSDLGVNFFTMDHGNTVIWGQYDLEKEGLYMARPVGDGSGKVQFVKLNTDLFGSSSGSSATPYRVIVADDGNVYGIFKSWHLFYDNDGNGDWESRLALYQILPYDGVPKLQLILDNNRTWWRWMDKTPFQIAKGHVFYKDSHDPADGNGKRDVIKMTKLKDRETKMLLSDGRYKIFRWSLHKEKLYFAGLNMKKNTAIAGEIDTAKVKEGEPESSYLTIKEIASPLQAAAVVRDIEILSPKQTEEDNGTKPEAKFLSSPENLYSNSIRFSKKMNRTAVETNLTYRNDSTSVDVPNLKLWVYNTLHLVPDLGGLLDMSSTTPLSTDTVYKISLEGSIADAWGRQLTPSSTTFTTRPSEGWWSGGTTDSGAFSSGKAAKYAGPAERRQMETYDTSTDVTGDVRIEFSAVNHGYINFEVVLWNKKKSGFLKKREVAIGLGLLSRVRYKRNKDSTYFSKSGYPAKPFSGFWMKYRIDIYGSNIKCYYSEEGANWTEIDLLAVDDYLDRKGDNATILIRLKETMELDNLKITALKADGSVKSSEGDILSENFEGGIPSWLNKNVNASYGFSTVY